MKNIRNNRKKQINDMVSIVKLAALMFTAIIFFQFFFGEEGLILMKFHNKSLLIPVFIRGIILASIYFIWCFATNSKIARTKYKYRILIENILFMIIFLLAILVSGGNRSEYKYIFLFLITSTTIQSGLKRGIFISIISSIAILAMDIFFMPGALVNKYFQNDLILSGIFLLTAWPLGFYVKIEGEHIDKLEELANKDGLTELYNHRYFYDSLRENLILANKDETSVAMVFIDIDNFKHYNDLYGHQMGDEVLRSIGRILRENTRNQDIPARYGGEEFAIILPNTTEKEAVDLANKIRNIIEVTKFYGEENQPNGTLTASMGISVYPYKAKDELELIKSADDALYRAKFFAKNRVETYTSILDELNTDIDEKGVEVVTSIKTLISVINAKDRYTYGHSERVVLYSRLLADKLELSYEDKKLLIYGAYMHDVGKINVSKDILTKRMPLTDEEWEVLKRHPEDGIEIIKPVKSLEDIIPIILNHHERFDGTGYPGKIKGEEIPYLARVLCVVDSFDAMTSTRPYNVKKTYDQAIVELRKYSGSQFDPQISEKFIEVINENKNKLDNLI